MKFYKITQNTFTYLETTNDISFIIEKYKNAATQRTIDTIAKNPNTPPDILDDIIKTEFSQYREQESVRNAVRNPNVSVNSLIWILEQNVPDYIGEIVAENEKVPVKYRLLWHMKAGMKRRKQVAIDKINQFAPQYINNNPNDVDFAKELINFIIPKKDIYAWSDQKLNKELNEKENLLTPSVNIVLENDPNYMILSYPEIIFNEIRMTPHNRELVRNYFHPQKEKEKDEMINEIFGKHNNWYKKADTLDLIQPLYNSSLEDFLKTLVGKTRQQADKATSYVSLYLMNKYGIGAEYDPKEKALLKFMNALSFYIFRALRSEELDRLYHPEDYEDLKQKYKYDEYKRIYKKMLEQTSELTKKLFQLYDERKNNPSPELNEKINKIQKQKDDLSQDPYTLTEWGKRTRKTRQQAEDIRKNLKNTPLTWNDLKPDGSDEWINLKKLYQEFQQYL